MSETIKKASLKYQLKSFRWAFNGLSNFFRSETKAIIHLAAAILIICLGSLLKITAIEWVLITIAIGVVFIAEIINTAIEKIVDCIPDKFDSTRGKVKDLAAGGVLIASVCSIIIGCIVFIPKILTY